MTDPLLRVEHLHKIFAPASGTYNPDALRHLSPVHDLNFDVQPGEIVALVGEDGAGKSTLTRTLAILARPDKGKVFFEGRDLSKHGEGAMRPIRRRLQVLFSDPRTALNPAHLVSETMLEPLKVQHLGKPEEQLKTIKLALRQVGLNSLLLDRRLTALSAGERQRVALARVLTLNPTLIICDDPTKTLTPLAGEQLFKLMADIRQKQGTSFLWLVSRTSLVSPFADRLGILYQGRLVEFGKTSDVLTEPQHPYTRKLLATKPVEAPTEAQPPKPLPNPFLKGCPYQSQCPHVMAVCRQTMPPLAPTPAPQVAACFLYSQPESVKPRIA